MRLLASFCFGLALVVCLVSAQSPTLPSNDSFYLEPSNISSYALGAIVRGRKVNSTIAGFLPLTTADVGAAYQYMYRSNDSLGKPVADVMTYLVPKKSDNSSLLGYSIAYDSADNDCSPSYALQSGANTNIGGEILAIQAALNKGWHVVTSDFEGLRAQFVAGIQAGNAVLDSIRASISDTVRQDTGLRNDAHYALFGYSGGSLASEWAIEMAPTYAPDLTRFVGAAIGGLTPNVTNVLLYVQGGIPAGLAFSGTLGLAAAYDDFAKFLLKDQMKPSKVEEFYYIGSHCENDVQWRGLGHHFADYFIEGEAMMSDQKILSVLEEAGQQGLHGTPQMPLFVFKAEGDEVSPIADTDQLVRQFCDAGVQVVYVRNSFGEHVLEYFLGLPSAFAWLDDRFNGVPLDQKVNCQLQNITILNATDGGAREILGPQLGGLFQTAFDNSTRALNQSLTTLLGSVVGGVGSVLNGTL